jgi:hypothetical protein
VGVGGDAKLVQASTRSQPARSSALDWMAGDDPTTHELGLSLV